jgi:putative ABC transport system ATP-binding protein
MPGEIAIIVGPSGSGKSTLLSLLGGLDRPISGDILINDQSIVKLNEDQLALMRRKNIGYVFQFFNLIPHLSALENVELPMSIANMSRKEARERARYLLDEVGLTPRAHHRPDQLSGGEQQRVAIARSLANRPAVVLADEPTGISIVELVIW